MEPSAESSESPAPLEVLERERRRARPAEHLAATLARVGGAPDLEAALVALVSGGVALLGGTTGVANIFGPEPGTRTLAVRVRPDGSLRIDRGPTPARPGSMWGDLHRGGPARVVGDLWTLDPAVYPEPLVQLARERGVRSSVAVPIDAGGSRLGSLHIDHAEPHVFDLTDLALAQALATQAGAAIQRARADEARRQQEEQLAAIVAHLPSGVVVVDTHGRIQLINRAALALFGVADGVDLATVQAKAPGELAEQLRFMQVRDPVTAEPLPVHRSVVSRALAGSAAPPHEVLIRPLDSQRDRHLVTSAVPLRDVSGATRGAVIVVSDVTAERAQQARRDALLRIAQRFAAETQPALVLRTLLHEALALLDGEAGGVFRWDLAQEVLLRIESVAPGVTDTDAFPPIPLGVGAAGQAAARRAPVIIDDYQASDAFAPMHAPMREAGIRAAVGVPLLREGHLIGALSVGTSRAAKCFTPEDAALLEVMASIGAAAVAGAEQSRLDGALLVARTVAHELNNALAPVLGYAELLTQRPSVAGDPKALTFATEIAADAREAAETVRRFQRIVRLEEDPQLTGTGDLPVLDLHRSTARR